MISQLSACPTAEGFETKEVDVATVFLSYNNGDLIRKLATRGKHLFNNKVNKALKVQA